MQDNKYYVTMEGPRGGQRRVCVEAMNSSEAEEKARKLIAPKWFIADICRKASFSERDEDGDVEIYPPRWSY